VATLTRRLPEIEEARIKSQSKEESDLAHFWEMAKLVPESPFLDRV
jgi:hypothetical protein